MLTKEEMREILMAHGFTIKPGQDDLKPYVYAAAKALCLAAVEKRNVRTDVCGNHATAGNLSL